jgi:hypothetical protein
MKRIALIMLCLLALGCTAAKNRHDSGMIITPAELAEMNGAQVENALINGHPANYFTLAAKLFSEGNKQEGVKWFYVGQIRYRAYLQANPSLDPSGDPALFSSLMYTVGTPLNGYIGGDTDAWMATIDSAVQWHDGHPDNFLDKDKNQAVYSAVLSGLDSLKQYIADNKDAIRKEREANGLENR